MILRRLISKPEFTVDQYDSFAWVNVYSNASISFDLESNLKNSGAQSAVKISKFAESVPSKPEILFGDVPEKAIVDEFGVKYEIRCKETFHPGLFLDHQLTREWLKEKAAGKTLLNLFSYTGSLAIQLPSGQNQMQRSIN